MCTIMVFVVTVAKLVGTSNFKNATIEQIFIAILIVPTIFAIMIAIVPSKSDTYTVFVDSNFIVILDQGKEVARRCTLDYRGFRPSLLGPVNVMQFNEAAELEIKYVPPIKLFQIARYIIELQTGDRLSFFKSIKMWFGIK